MNRAALMTVVLVAVLCGGCAMCQNPYDYCNAVPGPNGCPNCNFGARRGSLFAPIGQTPPTTALGGTRFLSSQGQSNVTPEPAEAEPPAADTPPSYLDDSGLLPEPDGF